jgi:starch synthase
VCSDGALKGIGDLPLAPLYSWDAVVCTSTAGRAVVESALEQRLEAMLARFRFSSSPALAVELPQLPVIPLAGPTEQPFEPLLSRTERRQLARQQLNLSQEAFVVAFVGRLSFHSKAHPISLYRALDELAAANPTQQIILIECGHLFNSWIAGAYDELRARFPRIEFRLVGGLQPADESEKWRVLAAADVFTSPADNLQETFGLSLLEAMIAELPLVVSDWNGYRDLVEHGVNGFLVPTVDVLQSARLGCDELELAYSEGRLTYDQMIGLRSLGVIVDHSAYLRAFQTLLDSIDTRLAMAKSALLRLKSRFSPEAVALAYRELWADLGVLRSQAAALPEFPNLSPILPSYSKLFWHYSTHEFYDLDAYRFRRACSSEDARVLLYSVMNQQQMQRITAGRLDQILVCLQSSCSLSGSDLSALGLTEYQCRSTLAALCKMGLLEPIKDPC